MILEKGKTKTMDLFVEKDTDLMRSTFIAVGVATLFYELGGRQVEVRLKDLGGVYHIGVPYNAGDAHAHLRRRTEERLPTLIPAIRKGFSSGEQKELEKDPNSDLRFKYVPQGFQGAVVEYEREKEIAKAAPRGKAAETREEGGAPQADRDYPLWANLCSYFGKGSAMRIGYPAVLHGWFAHHGENAHLLLDMILECFGDSSNDIERLRDRWKRDLFRKLDYSDYALLVDISALAIVSPSTSKGGSSLTGAALLVENTPDAFWLVMYFAFAGYMTVAMPFNLDSDVLTYYPLPRDISLAQLRIEMDSARGSAETRRLYSFSNLMLRAKLDIMAAIAFYGNMLMHFEAQQPNMYFGDFVDAHSGFVGYYYKDISTEIPFDETLFALPLWLPNAAHHDVDALQEARLLLRSHYDLIDAIKGKAPKYKMTADELVVLNAYREFITRGEHTGWIDFVIRYNLYHFRTMSEIYTPDLHLTIFERTLLNMPTNPSDHIDYRPMLENHGFRAIASAIRSATVTNRYYDDVKHMKTGFKTRHGLGDDLLRNADNPELFVASLSQFLFDYARESSNVQAGDANRTRAFVSETDIQEVIGLIATYGSRVVANLLVATGYASAYQKQSDNS